jgi:L-lactate dehydrogenase complex protein LldG
MMNARDAILGRIHTALSADARRPELPPSPQVWPATDASPDAMAERFVKELVEVFGEAYRVPTMADARRKLAAMMAEDGWDVVGAMDRPLCRELTADLEPDIVIWSQSDWKPIDMAQLPVGLVEADVLLADTGSAMIACYTPQDRMMCYLPPACVVIATIERLAEHLPAAWGAIAKRVAAPELRGEFVFVTGPSRTADIEKILILGVHGPKRLVVLVVG